MLSRSWRELPRWVYIALVLGLWLGLLGPPHGPAPAAAQTSSQQKIDPVLRARMAASPAALLPVIVELAAPSPPFTSSTNLQLAQQAVAILRANGVSVGGLPSVSGAAGFANAVGITAMSLLSQVAAVDDDSVVQPTRPAVGGPAWPPGRLGALYPREVGADRLRVQGTTGRGVGVAVLDSGVAADPDLVRASNRIVASVGFAGPRDPARPDPGGHGTHVAGTIAGDGTQSAGEFVGMAPGASIVDVQVLERDGHGRKSAVIRGIEWVLRHQSQYHIRVVNLSVGTPATGSYRHDPLAAAVETAWKHNLVVVAAAGNGGPTSGAVVSPGIDPYAITVGASDDQATLHLTDDLLAWFSAWGVPIDSTAKPDLVAPGRRIVSLRVPGSTLDTLLPDHVVAASNGATYFRLTGTSMATGVVSGAVALLLERRPDLRPDQVKYLLRSTAQRFGGGATAPAPGTAGAGLLDAWSASTSTSTAVAYQGLRPADGLARTLYPIVYGQPLAWYDPAYQGMNWAAQTWQTLSWTNIAWDNYVWDGVAWDNIAWDNLAWDGVAWDNIAWDNIAWDNIAWDSLAFD